MVNVEEETKGFPKFAVTSVIGTTPKGDWREFKPEIDTTRCTKCWVCVDFCPDGNLTKGEEGPELDLRFCKGCGICANECIHACITMIKE